MITTAGVYELKQSRCDNRDNTITIKIGREGFEPSLGPDPLPYTIAMEAVQSS